MKHILVCREYAPAPSGGIGTYAGYIARMLAEAGETMHIIAMQWKRATKPVEEFCNGRLIVHRIPFLDWKKYPAWVPHEELLASQEAKAVYYGMTPSAAFGWQASQLAEQLIAEEGIDLVESQEFEAPLYWLQLRRALGLRPKNQPPCLIHLHSPTDIITFHNDEDMAAPYRLLARRLEDYTIQTADAHVCPSQHLARTIEQKFGFEQQSISTIRLPMGDLMELPRSNQVWEKGPIVFIGRLAAQKGVMELIEAMVPIMRKHNEVTLELIGGDVPYHAYRNRYMLGYLLERIPSDLRNRFIFHEEINRRLLAKYLARARISVIPSRFENFPYTCIESLALGLPVVACPTGGMQEMVVDQETGWIAADASVDALSAALMMAVETPPEKLQAMGHRASKAIREICDNQRVLQEHLEFREQIVKKGVSRSVSLPSNYPFANRKLNETLPKKQASVTYQEHGLAVVIPCYNMGSLLAEALRSIKLQRRKPVMTVVVDDGSNDYATMKILARAKAHGWHVLHKTNGGLVSARNAGIEYILKQGIEPLGFVFLDADDRLRSDYIAICESILKSHQNIGLVSCFTWHFQSADMHWTQPCPTFPYQWLTNEAAPFSAIRYEALQEAGYFRKEMNRGYEDWDLFNAVMAAGWQGVTVPKILGECRVREDSMRHTFSMHAHGRMRQIMLERFPELVTRDAMDLVLLNEAYSTWNLQEEVFILRGRIARMQTLVKNPVMAARFVLGKAKSRARKLLKSTFAG